VTSFPPGLDMAGVALATETVRTERLVLRPHRTDDQDAVFRACQDEEIQHWISALPVPYTAQAAREFVERSAPRTRAERRGLPVAIDAGDELVGSGGIYFREGRLGPEIGYWIAPPARGNGYAAEATRGLADWAFDHGAARVHLFVDVANGPSQTVARRAGFAKEGVVRSCIEYRDGSRADAVLFSRLPGD
jgi:RimJ/RimL family protein N-acetyltransferase